MSLCVRVCVYTVLNTLMATPRWFRCMSYTRMNLFVTCVCVLCLCLLCVHTCLSISDTAVWELNHGRRGVAVTTLQQETGSLFSIYVFISYLLLYVCFFHPPPAVFPHHLIFIIFSQSLLPSKPVDHFTPTASLYSFLSRITFHPLHFTSLRFSAPFISTSKILQKYPSFQ